MPALAEREQTVRRSPVTTAPSTVMWPKVNPAIAKNREITINLSGAMTADLLTATEKGAGIVLPGNLSIRTKEVFAHNARALEEMHHVENAAQATEFLESRFNIKGAGDSLYLVQRMMEASGD